MVLGRKEEEKKKQGVLLRVTLFVQMRAVFSGEKGNFSVLVLFLLFILILILPSI